MQERLNSKNYIRLPLEGKLSAKLTDEVLKSKNHIGLPLEGAPCQ